MYNIPFTYESYIEKICYDILSLLILSSALMPVKEEVLTKCFIQIPNYIEYSLCARHWGFKGEDQFLHIELFLSGKTDMLTISYYRT